jgi:CHAT domain-containing protein/tetratricopeptide (TPR) repeat protein
MTNRGSAFFCAAVLALAACRGPEQPAKHPAIVDREWPAAELRSGGGAVDAALSVGETHRYRLPLKKGSLLRMVVDQRRIDAVVTLTDPMGAEILKVDQWINDNGPELVLAVAAADGVYTLDIRGIESGPGRYRAQVETLRPAVEADQRSAEAYHLFTSTAGMDPEAALEPCLRALAIWQDLGEVALEAEALQHIAMLHFGRGDYQESANLALRAAAGFASVGDARWEVVARNDAGNSLLQLGEAQEAAEQYAIALVRARQVGDRLNQERALHGLGQAFQNQGELQKALDNYNQALALLSKDDRRLRPDTLHQLGVLYARFLHDQSHGRELLLAALDAWSPDQKREKARTLSQLGRIASEQGRRDEARQDYKEALKLRQDSDRCGSAVYLVRLALVEEGTALPARRAADERLAEALAIVSTQSCPKSEPTVRLLAAGVAEGRGAAAAAAAGYQRCAALFAGQGDRLGMAESLGGLARSERALGRREEARAASRQALDVVEGVRPSVLREDLRTSFFSAARDLFDFHIDLLLDLGDVEEAWVTAERARARALGDLLAEAGAGLRREEAPELAAREKALQHQLNVLESRRLNTNESKPDKLRLLRASIDARIAELETVRGELRRRSPRYASLLQPEPVSFAAVRRELLDGDTVVLEYRLGETASTLWVLTRESLTAAPLPPRREIEPLVQEASAWLKSLDWPGRNPRPLCELSRMLLAPAAPSLGHRRVVVVPDGALATLSFAALPVPVEPAACPQAPSLVESHEIAYLPSVATLLTQRRLLAGRHPAPGWLAVVADPVYGRDDGRLPRPAGARGAGPAQSFQRLPGSAQEAAAIVSGLPRDKLFVATGFDASRQTVTGGALRGYRILHFATHGVLDPEQPLLSLLALTQIDPAGRPVDGILPAHAIYDLDLPADLVVLSACETALGRDVPGEGLISGLPRAFLYAGASRVIVSLWPVEDQSTRELMVLFYRGLFAEGLAPAAALQEAQRTMVRAGRRPSQWAGFVLLGDWRPLPPFSN